MAVRQYIGARYVPLFMGEWDNTQAYEPLSIVLHKGDSYTSRQAVPVGIVITNTEYWALSSSYNAQIEQYRHTVESFDERITNQEKKYIAIVGDSFSDGLNGTEWPSILAKRTGYTMINKAVAGTGFLHTMSSINFVTQMQEICADSRINQVEAIIIYGGINDWNHSTHEVTNYATPLLAIKAAYESIDLEVRPRLIFCFGNAARGYQSKYNDYSWWVKRMQTYIRALGLPATPSVENWLLFKGSNCYNDDLLHPNTTGQTIIADYMEQLVFGTYAGVHDIARFENLNHVAKSDSFVNVFFDDGLITFDAVLGDSTDHAFTEITSGATSLCSVAAPYYMQHGTETRFICSAPMQTEAFESKSTDNVYAAQMRLALNIATGTLALQLEAQGRPSFGYSTFDKLGLITNGTLEFHEWAYSVCGVGR